MLESRMARHVTPSAHTTPRIPKSFLFWISAPRSAVGRVRFSEFSAFLSHGDIRSFGHRLISNDSHGRRAYCRNRIDMSKKPVSISFAANPKTTSLPNRLLASSIFSNLPNRLAPLDFTAS
jgi:hypothetical protein